LGLEYVSVEEAIGRDGLRMVVVGGVPGVWGKAARPPPAPRSRPRSATAAALDPVLLAHRDMMYQRHLALPLQL
jgi:hypothetical protein